MGCGTVLQEEGEERLMFISVSCPGNIHGAVSWINTLPFKSFLWQLVPAGTGCIAIFKCPAREDFEMVTKALGLTTPYGAT